jgi:hypothetical protein
MCHLRRRERTCRVCQRRIFVTIDRRKCLAVKFSISKEGRQWAACRRNDPLTYKVEWGTCKGCALPVELR